MTRDEYLQMYAIVGAAMEVHGLLGRGMEEAIYQEALCVEFDIRRIPYEREKVLHTWYKGNQLKKIYIADFYSEGVMIELKSVSQLNSEHRAQLMNYMRITKTNRGLLLNFGEKQLRTERYLYIPEQDEFVLISQNNLNQYITD